jgi:diguanylate cyclase (GGDEF)-like protein
MFERILHRRVLFAAAEPARSEIRSLFQADILRDWEVIEAQSLECAHFLLQLDPCDVLLVDCSLSRPGGGADLSWLADQRLAPVLFLGDSNTETIVTALRQGIHYWLPRELALHHVPVLAAMLRQATEFGDEKRRGREVSAALEDSRRQVSRLVNLLWEAVPSKGETRWFTQRYMLERLEEEMIRTQRYGGSLSVVLGELGKQPATGIADQISRVKRRCDVAGQYGLQGFMLILPQTDEAGANGCCQRLRNRLTKPAELLHASESLRVHLGIANLSPETRSVKSLLSRAEEQLERDKLDAHLSRDRKGAASGVA